MKKEEVRKMDGNEWKKYVGRRVLISLGGFFIEREIIERLIEEVSPSGKFVKLTKPASSVCEKISIWYKTVEVDCVEVL